MPVIVSPRILCPGPADLNGVPCRLVARTADLVQVECDIRPASGKLRQEFVACCSSELHQAFDCFWSQIWQRDGADASGDLREWSDFCRIIEGHDIPRLQISVQSSNPSLWAEAIRRMPVQKATGICGWAPSDLKLLPPEAVEILRLIFHKAVSFGLPPHLLRARVCVLAKTAKPESIQQSRPITIFSTLYRLWSSVLTRQVLRQWKPLFPQTVAGSMPQRSCRDLSYRQQQRIEASLLDGTRLLGASVDLVKCFNQIPWQPAVAMAGHVGAPPAELRFWTDCLRKMRRHSSFLGDLSEGLCCQNGAPEGDPFSVAIMAALCYFAIHIADSPGLTSDTYVDNWAWSASRPEPLCSGLPTAFDFLHSLSIPVDWSKSYCWATQRADRKWWMGQGQEVFPTTVTIECVNAAKDLGVAYCYDRRPHACLRDRKLEGTHQRLDRLRDQPRPVAVKASMVQRGVWPEIFYGCEGCTMPVAQIDALRGHAARAIVGQYRILSPHLALGALTSSVQDPQQYIAEKQLLALRRATVVDPETALAIVQVASCAGCPKRSYGPATALAITLHRLDVSLCDEGCVKGPDNTRLWLHACRKQEIKDLVQRAWARKVSAAVSHRNGLSNVPPPLPGTTGRLFADLPGLEQAVIARHVVGGFCSAAGRSRWADDEEPECPLCGAYQTKYHKLLQCPATSHVLEPVRELVEYALDRWPHWVHGPFALEPPDLEVNRLIFATRKLPTALPLPNSMDIPGSRGFLRMFTDGSCCHPTMRLASRAGFAVVVDTSTTDAEIPLLMQQWRQNRQLPQCFRVHQLGLVPGEQSIHRAEICAIIQASKLARLYDCPAEVWTDSQVAIDEWNRLESDALPLWPDLAHELGKVHSSNIRLCKVAAHANLDRLWGFPQWCCAGNTVADLAAKSTLTRDFELVIEASNSTAEFLSDQQDALLVFWKYLCRLSLEENALLKELQTGTVEIPERETDQAASVTVHRTAATSVASWLLQQATGGENWQLPPPPRDVLLACSWPPWFTVPLWQWTRGLRWSPAGPGEDRNHVFGAVGQLRDLHWCLPPGGPRPRRPSSKSVPGPLQIR